MRLPLRAVRGFLAASSPLYVPGRLPVAAQRTSLERSARLLPAGPVTPGTEGGVTGERHRQGAPRGLLYLHGGGYVLGSPVTHRGLAGRLARALDAEAFVPDYRLAPEHPWPAAIEDCVSAYDAFAARVGDVAVVGDSAGGGLALEVALRAAVAPRVVGLVCPWLDLTRVPPGSDAMLSPAKLEGWRRAYVPDGDYAAASPVHGDLSALRSRVVVHSAGDDPLRGDAELLAARAPEVEHVPHPGRFHVFHATAGLTREGDAAVAALAEALAR